MASTQKRSSKTSHELSPQLVHPFASIQKQVDKALHGFYDLFESKPFSLTEFENVMLAPAMDLIEDNQCYKLEVEMPGMDEKDIEVLCHDNTLTIRGQKTTSKKDHRKNYIAREINYGSYERSIVLPQAADVSKATASFKKGMLWISIPKRAGNKGNGHQIKIVKV